MTDENESRYKILVVDDDHDILTTIGLALKDLNQTLLTASDGIAALAAWCS